MPQPVPRNLPALGEPHLDQLAIEALTDSFRYEVSQLGIDVVLVQPSAYPTQLFTSATQPADTERTAEYGSLGEIPDAMFQQFDSMFSEPRAPNPSDIAQAIAYLIDTPKGERPARTVVGTSFGADTLNDAAEPVQASVVEAFGLGHLATVTRAIKKCA